VTNDEADRLRRTFKASGALVIPWPAFLKMRKRDPNWRVHLREEVLADWSRRRAAKGWIGDAEARRRAEVIFRETGGYDPRRVKLERRAHVHEAYGDYVAAYVLCEVLRKDRSTPFAGFGLVPTTTGLCGGPRWEAALVDLRPAIRGRKARGDLGA